MKLFKKIGVLLTAAAIILTSLTAFPCTVEAKKKDSLKNLDLRWNLKPGKEITFKTNYSGYGYIKIKAKIHDFLIEDLEDGQKAMSCTVVYTIPKLKLSKKDVDKIVKNDASFHYMWSFMDYNSGLSLEGMNDKDVMVEYGEWEFPNGTYKYKGNNGNTVEIYKSARKEINVVYPKDYKGLCMVIGGSTNPDHPEDNFFNGGVTFKNSLYYKKGMKDLSSLMRVKDFDK